MTNVFTFNNQRWAGLGKQLSNNFCLDSAEAELIDDEKRYKEKVLLFKKRCGGIPATNPSKTPVTCTTSTTEQYSSWYSSPASWAPSTPAPQRYHYQSSRRWALATVIDILTSESDYLYKIILLIKLEIMTFKFLGQPPYTLKNHFFSGDSRFLELRPFPYTKMIQQSIS